MSTPENDPTPAAAGIGVAVDDELEEFSDEFKCCVCLELIFKPVVLACGHISCFWCVLECMENRQEILQEACCPFCRHTYYHFPSICWQLQSVLWKLYPKVCLRRESQVAEKEKEYGTFSPQFENYLAASHGGEHISSQFHSLVLAKDCSDKKSPEPVPSDLLCVICKELLYRPVVLNCGHVFCEACIIDSCNESCRCPMCQSMHPNGFPKVCLVLVGFLEQHKSEEYAARREAMERVRTCELGGSSTGSTQVQQGAKSSSVPLHKYFCYSGHKVHDGVGCDSCGIYPLIGDRYKCKDCSVDIGFDLCGKCYNSSSNAPGRFNQQHKPDHTFELVEIDYIIVPDANNPCNIARSNPENQTNVAAPDPPFEENDVAGPDRANDSSSSDDDEAIEPTS